MSTDCLESSFAMLPNPSTKGKDEEGRKKSGGMATWPRNFQIAADQSTSTGALLSAAI